MCGLQQAPQPVRVPELANRVQSLRVYDNGALGGLREAHHPAVAERQHGDVGVVGQQSAAAEADDVAHAIEQATGILGGTKAQLGELPVERPAVRHGSFVRVRLELTVCAGGASSPEGDAYQCGVPVEYVVEGVVVADIP